MAAKNIVKIGVREATTETSKGVVILIATRKVICVRKSPNIEAMNMRNKSLRSTRSLGINRESKEKRITAPNARKVNKQIGGTSPDWAISLQANILKPKIK